MLVPIIVIAVISFLLVLFFFNYQTVLSFIKNLFKKKNKKTSKVKEEPKPEKYEPSYEDFKPIVKEPENDRDSSIEELLNMDDFDEFMYDDDVYDGSDNIFSSDTPSKSSIESFTDETFDEIFKKYNVKSGKKSLAKQIRELPPEIKAMVIDNILDKKNDI